MDIEISNDPEAFSRFENTGWDEISDAYERHFGPLTRQSSKSVMQAAQVDANARVLDVCTGPGMLAHEAIEIGAEVSGLDFSEEALTIARSSVPGATFHQGDAQNLPFDESSFDSVVCGFGIIHLPDPRIALQEMHRVLKPGGRVALSVWEAPNRDNGFGLIYGAIKAHGDMSVPLPHGPDFFQFSDESRFSTVLEQSGFGDVSVIKSEQFWHFEASSELISCVTDSTVRARGLLSAQSDSDRQKIIETIQSGIEKFRTSQGNYQVPMPALVGSGTK